MSPTHPGWRWAAIVVCVIGLVLAPGLSSGAVGTPDQSPRPRADNTVVRIQVYPNGSARWTVQIRTRLDTPSLAAEYREFVGRFRANESRYLDPFRERMKRVVSRAANVTGREMHAEQFSASIGIQAVPRRWGIVTYRFTWVGFAVEGDHELVVGDVFQGGFFLAENDALEIVAPDGYEIAAVEPAPDNATSDIVTWFGREDFASHRPRVVFTPVTSGTSPDRPSGTHSPGAGTGNGPDSTGGPWPYVLAILVLALVVGGAYIARQRRTDPDDSTASESMGSRSVSDTTSDSVAGTEDTQQRDSPPADEESATEVLTDAERVRALLEANDGRMRQAAIADEFDWSASKISRLVGNMVEEGTVEKLQLGRENLIDLTDDGE